MKQAIEKLNTWLNIGIGTMTLGLLLIWIAKLLAAMLLMLQLSGCAGGKGWQVSFGAVPINAVDNHSTLNTRDSIYNSKGDYQNERTNK